MDYRSCTLFKWDDGEWYYCVKGYIGEDPCDFHWTSYWNSWGPYSSLEAAKAAQDASCGPIERTYVLRGDFMDRGLWRLSANSP